MATVTKPIALDESLNTTEQTSRNIADVLAEELGNLVSVVSRIAPQTVYDLDDLGDVDITSPSNGQVLKYNGTSQKWENGTGGGSGDSVSWTQIQQTGTKIAEIEINGVSTDVYAPTGGGFSALLIITAGTGLTVTASKGGDTYTATEISTGTYEVSVDSAGTWTVSDGSNTATVAVSASTTYYVTLSSVPDGSTVLPTDDVSIWLACGQRSEAYTTLSQVLADSTCLSALISDNNAMDYLVRSTTWASDVCGDSSAMSYIGLNNYASNTLLADSTWCSAICNSTYFESVLNVKNPIMTDDTTPTGQAVASSVYNTDHKSYYAFDNDAISYWASAENVSGIQRVGYIFTSSVTIYKAIIRAAAQQWTFEHGSNYTSIGTVTPTASTEPVELIFNGISDNQFHVSTNNTSSYVYVRDLRFYGRADI